MKFAPLSNITEIFPGRYALTWRIALLCALMAVFAMVYEIPESAISCYLIIYLMKIDANENIVMAIAIIILLSLTVFFIFIIINLTINSPFLRFITIFCCSYLLVFLGAMFNVTRIGNLLALVVAFLLTLISDVPTGEIATRGLLYALLMAASPMFLMILFNGVIGKKSQTILIEKYLYRLSIVQDIIKEPANNKYKFDLLLKDSTLDCESHLKIIKIFHLQSKEKLRWLEHINKQTHRLLALATIIPRDTSIETRTILSDYCQKLRVMINTNQMDINVAELDDNLVVHELCNTLNEFSIIPEESVKKRLPKKKDINHYSKLRYHAFAFKVTISAIICYCIYTITDWQGIHTAMITCYVVALGTTAETIHKLLLRIMGCLLGALMGVLTIIYIVPDLQTIAALFILIFIGMLLPSWITVGSELFSYAGVQIGLAFLLTVLNGFSPSTDLVVAQDRILGILLGNVVCFVIFTYLWPVSLSASIYNKLTDVLRLSSTNTVKRQQTDLVNFIKLINKINNIDYDIKLVIFDINLMKLSTDEVKVIYILIRKLSKVNTLLLLPIAAVKKERYQNELLQFIKNNVIDSENIANIYKLNKLLHRNIISLSKDI
ncbi:FUSC family protein [Orbus mooreae]|uniref:FUSC family protein n=1 Tax=Orbus mooreae TaxID=3074107 RepID=UPI00370D6F45